MQIGHFSNTQTKAKAMKDASLSTSASLAVLPFENLSGKEEYKYFSRGLIEELIVDLSHFSGLQVVSSYTSKRMGDPDIDDIEAARQIDVNYLLKGSLYLQPESIRINTQLVDSSTRKIIWGDRFDSPLDALFATQASIVERVVFAISSEVKHDLLVSAREKPVTTLAAYDCWLRGMDHLRHGTLEADHEARKFFNQALAIDPNYSRAYVGLSLSHFNEWSCQLWELYEESANSAFAYATKAFQLNEGDHVVQMILGRIYLYRRQFDQAEHHISRSFELNSNDADNLVQLASCMAFLGRVADGEKLFKKALRLNPYRNLWYYQYGSLVYFVAKRYQTSIELALKRQLVNVWVDLPGYIAAAYAYLGDEQKAWEYISLFIESFKASITRGRKPTVKEIVDWVRQANPFKHQQDGDCVIDGLNLAGLEKALSSGELNTIFQAAKSNLSSISIFKKEDAIWRFQYEEIEATMPELKGFYDISRLLTTPETEVHCTELMGAESSMDENDFTLDEKARKAYQQRIIDLQEDIREAKEYHDLARKEQHQQELDQLIDHLSKSLGVGGKPRKMKSSAERARAAVTLRIRSAIKKIASHHPSLAKHLSNSIRTGVFCCYSPEEEREWILH